MKNNQLLALVIIVSLLLAACDAAPQEETEKPGQAVLKNIVVVTPAPMGNSATLAVGDLLVIELPTIPTEGWTWVPDQLDTAILEQVAEAEYTAGTDPNDAGGIYRLQFKAVGTGTVYLSLLYVNSLRMDNPPMSKNSFGMEVIVN